MKIVAAYLLAVIGGNTTPTKADVKKILEAASANADDVAIEKVVSQLSGKNVYDVIDEGTEKLAAVPSGGARSGGAAPAAAADAAPAAAAAAPEEEEESDEEMGFGLFD